MPDHPDHSAFDDSAIVHSERAREAARLSFAAARVRTLAEVELRLLELAVQTPDDDSARRLELHADEVWCDALAVSAEHDADPQEGAS